MSEMVGTDQPGAARFNGSNLRQAVKRDDYKVRAKIPAPFKSHPLRVLRNEYFCC